MIKLADFLRDKREQLSIKIKDIVQRSSIDQALISKYEGGKRIPSKDHLSLLASAYEVDIQKLKEYWLAEKVHELMVDDVWEESSFVVMESRVEYLLSSSVLNEYEFSEAVGLKLKKVDTLHKAWNKVRPLSNLKIEKLRSYYKIKYTYESNKIEGNTLTLSETKLVVEDGLTIGGKSLNEHLEAINHAEAIEYIYELINDKVEFDEKLLLTIHGLILRGIDRENAGRYRKVPVRITGSEHIPPQPYLLGKMMEEYFDYYSKMRKRLHPVLLAAEMHERLVSIHPFIDGNGRTSRLIMNFILLKHGYTIANLKGASENRLAYYNALEKVQLDNEVEHFYNLILDHVIASMEEHLELAG